MLGKARQHVVKRAGIAITVEQVKGVGHVQAALAGGIGSHGRERVIAGDLADTGGARVLIEQVADALQIRQILRLLDIVLHPLIALRVARVDAFARRRRVVGQGAVMEVVIDDVEAEAVHPQIQPETQVVQLRLSHLGMMEIQVRLTGQEVVQIVLAALGIKGPGATTEGRHPVVGRVAIRKRVGPDIPVGLGVVTVLTALLEPDVLIGAVR